MELWTAAAWNTLNVCLIYHKLLRENKMKCYEIYQWSYQKQINKIKINREKLRQYFNFSRLIVK